MHALLQSLFPPSRHDSRAVASINKLRCEYQNLSDDAFNQVGANAAELLPLIAATAVIAERVLGERMFDVQLRGALALTRGSIAEMQTGEGKTLHRGAGHRLACAHARRRSRHDRQRLSGAARHRMDGRNLSAPRPERGLHPARHVPPPNGAQPTRQILPTPPLTSWASIFCGIRLRSTLAIKFTARSTPLSSTKPIPFSLTKPVFR